MLAGKKYDVAKNRKLLKEVQEKGRKFAEEIKINYQVEFGTVQKWMPDPPFVMLGCSAKAVDKISLGQHLSDAIHGKLNLKSAQEKYFALDGQNAKRAAEKIASLI